jgi:formate hydrogenlyase subunit 3/multisubunit Na+/H+ antiporter MnhD subunit
MMLTNEVSIKQFHMVFSVSMLFVSAFFFCLFLWCSYIRVDVMVNLDIFTSPVYSYSLSLTLTPYSIVFSSLVSLITGIVFIYSYRYIGFYSNYKFFLFTTFGFVLSMLVVINFSDLFIVMLG